MSLLENIIKHPLVWMGAGMLIRNYGQPQRDARLWAVTGAIALAVGISHASDNFESGTPQNRTLLGVLNQILPSSETV